MMSRGLRVGSTKQPSPQPSPARSRRIPRGIAVFSISSPPFNSTPPFADPTALEHLGSLCSSLRLSSSTPGDFFFSFPFFPLRWISANTEPGPNELSWVGKGEGTVGKVEGSSGKAEERDGSARTEGAWEDQVDSADGSVDRSEPEGLLRME
jgi:hypothetical protein